MSDPSAPAGQRLSLNLIHHLKPGIASRFISTLSGILTLATLVFLQQPVPSSAADFSLRTAEPGTYSIEITGKVTQGDSGKFRDLIAHVPPLPAGYEGPVEYKVFMNSPGGDYVEGILLGLAFNDAGASTYVRKGEICYSACAMAFLGGSFRGATGGSVPSRHLEVGGKVGFHSFDVERNGTATEATDGIDVGKVLTLMTVSYGPTLDVDVPFLIKTLTTPSGELFLIDNVGLLRLLEIQFTGLPRVRGMTHEMAVNLCNYGTGWQRPVALVPDGAGTATTATILEMDPAQMRRYMLESVSGASDLNGPLTKLIRLTLSSGKDGEISAAFDDAVKLGLLPLATIESRVIRVSGFTVGAGFYTKNCFVFPHKEGSDDLAADVVLQDTGGLFSTPKLHPYPLGQSPIYELFSPATKIQVER